MHQWLRSVQRHTTLVAGAAAIAAGPAAVAQCTLPPHITLEPHTTYVCTTPGQSATFTVQATGGELAYQWQQMDLGPTFPEFIDISDGYVLDIFGNIMFASSGANTSTLTLSESVGFAQIFRCKITNACGTTHSSEAAFVYCHVDYDCNSAVGVSDIFAFLQAWFQQAGLTGGGNSADFDYSETVDVTDIFAFLGAWFIGCG